MAKDQQSRKSSSVKKSSTSGASDVFSRYDTSLRDYTQKQSAKSVGDQEVVKPHAVRLAKGIVPYTEVLNPYQQFAKKILGPVAERYVDKLGETQLDQVLIKAHIKLNVSEFYAVSWMTTLITGIVIGIIVAFMAPLLHFFGLPLSSSLATLALLGVIPIVYLISFQLPKSTASARKKDIDRRISHAMSFVSTLASADVNIDVIFKELAKQPMYGEIQKEAQWITRDVDLLGKDILNAIRDGALRTPSNKFQDFLQGVVTTTLSGGHLKPYFVMKTEQFQKEAKMASKANMETLGMMAESFVTVVVAMPLFLIVMMSLMGMIGSGGSDSLVFLYIIVYLMIPMSQVGFIIVLQSLTQEV
jgi:archaeal flagellar protein FlaJ